MAFASGKYPPRRATAALFLGLLLAAVAVSSSHASDAPRKVAFAPFSALTDDAKPVAPLLARLLAVRVAARTGADVLAVPADGADPAAAAKEGGYPFLVTGTVTRLGKGYSLDVSAKDSATGASVGAFYAEAATEDGLIPALAPLAAQLSEKLFGVKADPVPPPAAAPTPPQGVPPPAAVPPPVSAPPPAAAAELSAAAPAPAAVQPFSSLERVARSEAVADELVAVAAGDDRGPEGAELVAMGSRTIYLFRVKGGEISLRSRFVREVGVRFLDVAAADLDGDGRKEFLVSAIRGDRFDSLVLARDGEGLAEWGGKIPWYLAVVPGALPAPAVAGQGKSLEGGFAGKAAVLAWAGRAFTEGERLPLDFGASPFADGGIAGLSAVSPAGKGPFYLYNDTAMRLRVLDGKGKELYRSPGKFAVRSTSFEFGPFLPMEGKRASFDVRRAPRAIPSGEGRFLLAAVEAPRGGILSLLAGTGSGDGARVVLLEWTGDDFRELAGSPREGREMTGADFLASPPFGRGGRVATTVVEKREGGLTRPESRVTVFEAR